MFRILLVALVTFKMFAGGLQKTAKVETLSQAVDELLSKKDTSKFGKRLWIGTVDGKKIEGYLVRFADDTLVLHDRRTGSPDPVTKLVSLRQIKTVDVRRKRGSWKTELASGVATGVFLALVLPGSLAMLTYATPPFLATIVALAIVNARPSFHTVFVAP